MGHSEQWQRDLDSAAEVEHSVWAALERAKLGVATADDWQLLEWACGFAQQVKTVNRTIDNCTF